MSDTDEIRIALTALHRQLSAIDDTAQASGADLELDQTKVGRLSRMDAIQTKHMEQATHRRRIAQLNAIEAALERLETGEYGWCQNCGEKISTTRLDHNPAAATCISCAR